LPGQVGFLNETAAQKVKFSRSWLDTVFSGARNKSQPKVNYGDSNFNSLPGGLFTRYSANELKLLSP